ncbi:bifunctional protein-disulfide isomerase/oxidoreductase DsbC [Pseudomonas sp. WN033]|nr:bifunctional protein-disulfide isomerase/oxidoreductase DsbC [Pseudomonas sp. WN033]
MRLKYLAGVALALLAGQALADDQAIRDTLGRLNISIPVKSISETPISGLYQVQLENGRVLYASADGRYMLQGALFQVDGEQPRNLTAAAESKVIGELINSLPRDELVIFSPEQPKTHITVFTDVDCGYCRKLHTEVEELNALGIEVRYAAFPRSGMNTPTATTMQSIWCAADKQAAMTRAKAGQSVPQASCDNPVEAQFALGAQVGVQGTPAIFLANGTLVPGYKPAGMLAEEALANQ